MQNQKLVGYPQYDILVPSGDDIVAIKAFSQALTSNVSMPSAGVFYDGPSLLLQPGTYIFFGTALISSSGNSVAKIWDGTTVYAGCEATYSPSGIPLVSGLVTLNSVTTIKISGASVAAAGTFKATTDDYAVPGASILTAIQIV